MAAPKVTDPGWVMEVRDLSGAAAVRWKDAEHDAPEERRDGQRECYGALTLLHWGEDTPRFDAPPGCRGGESMKERIVLANWSSLA